MAPRGRARLVIACLLTLLLMFLFSRNQQAGLADNGDFTRTMAWVASRPESLPGNTPPAGTAAYDLRFYHYWIPLWHLDLRLHRLVSTSALLVAPGVLLGMLIHPGVVSLRLIGWGEQCGVALVFFWFVMAGMESLAGTTLLGAAFVAMLSTCDYAAYYRSFYDEAAAGVYFLGCLATIALVIRRPSRTHVALYLSAATLLAACKVQYLCLWPLSIVLLLRLLQRAGRLTASRGALILVAGLVFAAAPALALWRQSAVQGQFHDNDYNRVYDGILTFADLPAAMLARAGVGDSACIGTIIYTPKGQGCAKAYPASFSRASAWRLLAGQPAIAWRMLRFAADCMQDVSLEYLGKYAVGDRNAVVLPRVGPSSWTSAGNRDFYTQFSGPRWNLWSRVKYAVFPRGGALVAYLAAIVVLFVLTRGAAEILALRYTALFCSATCASQIAVAVFGDGREEIIKHLYLANVAFDASLILGLGATAILVRRPGVLQPAISVVPALRRMFARFTRAPGDYDVASFDVFDTLIARAIESPADVFRIVRAKMLSSPSALSDPDTIDGFPALRVAAERLARLEKARIDGHAEVTLTEIYAALGRLTRAAATTLEQLERSELQTEREVMHANPEGAERLARARAQSKRVILCSDMYLSSGAIADLLRSCGYDGRDPLYVSCEHAASKHQGTLYARINDATGIAPGRVLHTGDDHHGDVRMARRAGWRAQHLPRLPSLPAAPMPWAAGRMETETVSAVVGGLVLRRQRERAGAVVDPWQELGFRVFGPLFTGYLLWLKRAVMRRPPDRLLLFARDAHWLREMLPRFLAGAGPPPAYLFVSRGSLLLPSMTDLPPARLKHLFSGRVEQTVSAHLRRLGLDACLLGPAILSVGFGSADETVRNGDARMCALLAKVQHLLLRESARRRPIVQSYLDPFVAGASDVMAIDIGWVGNMQASFIRLLETRHAGLRVRGYYVGLFASAGENDMPGHTMQGWLTRPGDPPDVECEMWWRGGVELAEFAMRAPHGTTLGYRHGADGTTEPCLEESAEEDALASLSARLQAGASLFIESFLACYGTVPAEGLDSRAWGAPFHRLVTAPTAQEASLLGDISHSDKAGSSDDRLTLAPKVTDPSALFAALRNCFWPAGFRARNGGADEASFNEMLYLAEYPDVAAAVASGDFRNGHAHWLSFGRRENRVSDWRSWTRRQAGLQ